MATETLEIVIKGSADGLQKATGAASSALSGLANIGKTVLVAGLAAGAAAIGGLVAGLGFAIGEAMEAQEGMAQLDAVLKSTGGAAGVTRDMALELADSLSEVTRFSDDSILSAENLLLTFTNIGEDVFPRATETLLDMATALGTDAKGSAIQLGKALNDPIAGITALTHVGVTFSEEQKTMIAALVESGDLMGAQTIILDELTKEFGGSAEAAGQTFAGQLDILKNSLANVAEGVGMALLPMLQDLTGFVMENVMPWIISAGEGLGRLLSIFEAHGWQAFFTTLSDGSTPLSLFFEALGIGQEPARKLVEWVADAKVKFDGFLESLTPVKEALQNLYDAFIESLPKMQEQGEAFGKWFDEAFGITWPGLIDNLSGSINGLAELWRQHGETVIRIVDGFTRLIMTTFGGALLLITGLINANITGWTGDWAGGWEIMRETLERFLNLALSLVGTDLEKFKASWIGTFDLIKLAFKTWTDGLVLDLSIWFLNMLETWQGNWDLFQGIIDTVIDNIMGFFAELKTNILGVVATVEGLIQKILDIPGIPGGDNTSGTGSGGGQANLTVGNNTSNLTTSSSVPSSAAVASGGSAGSILIQVFLDGKEIAAQILTGNLSGAEFDLAKQMSRSFA